MIACNCLVSLIFNCILCVFRSSEVINISSDPILSAFAVYVTLWSGIVNEYSWLVCVDSPVQFFQVYPSDMVAFIVTDAPNLYVPFPLVKDIPSPAFTANWYEFLLYLYSTILFSGFSSKIIVIGLETVGVKPGRFLNCATAESPTFPSIESWYNTLYPPPFTVS